MAIEIVSFPIKNGDFPLKMVIFPLKIVIFLLKIVIFPFIVNYQRVWSSTDALMSRLRSREDTLQQIAGAAKPAACGRARAGDAVGATKPGVAMEGRVGMSENVGNIPNEIAICYRHNNHQLNNIWVCLKIGKTPKNPMVFMIIIPF